MIAYSIIQKSQLKDLHRIDADYYQPEYLKVEQTLKSIKTVSIHELSESVVNFGAYSLCNYIVWQESGIPYLNVENIKDGYIDFHGVKFIDDEVNEILKKSKVKEGQVIVTMAGTIGNVGVAHKAPSKINSNQATAKITLKNDFSPYVLAAFLNSYYGRKQTEREIVSSVQPNIFLWQIKNLKVPVLSKDKEREIEYVYIKGLDTYERSELLYSQAENLLLEKLGLKDFEPEDELSYVVNLSDVKFAHRADAAYFQPKYHKILQTIEKKNLRSLGKIATIKRGIEPGSGEYRDEGKAFIRVSNLSKYGIIEKNQKYLDDDFYQRLQRNFEPKIGEILLTKDATPGIAYVVREALEGIISGGILRLKLKEDIEAEYLALCINTIIGQMQIERDAGGSVIAHWKPEQIKKMEIPIPPKSTQKKIADLLIQSHQARKMAKNLLEKAKREVERFVEKTRIKEK
jgi:type I restriction enzyme, S subunit